MALVSHALCLCVCVRCVIFGYNQNIQLSVIIGPNGQRMPGCLRQCLIGNFFSRAASVIFALSRNRGKVCHCRSQ